MQITATLSEGLKREFRVVVPVSELAERTDARLEELKGQVRLPGFRPGKVPSGHLKRMYGKSVVAEVVEAMVGEANQKILTENGLKLAGEPNVRLPENEEEAQAVFEGQRDLDYIVSFEVLPTIEATDLSKVAITRPVAEVADKDVDDMLDTMAKGNAPFETKKGKAAKGDRVTIDFVGTIDGVAFDGGTGTDMPVVLGSNSFIPGFEDQLVGVKAGDETVLNVTFPKNYNARHLADKAAAFAVTVKLVEKAGEAKIDDEFAKTIGFDDLEKLKEAVRERIKADLDDMSRRAAKRDLLDKLDALYTFELPQGLVEAEFDNVWRQVTADLASRNASFEDEGTTEEKARAEYRAIAERRVRLGLVIADIGEKNAVQVTDDEVTRALVNHAREFPGQEQQVWDYYRKNPQAMASLRAPIFEDKVVDYIFGQAKVKDKKVSKDQLAKTLETDDEAA